jgi:tRNA1(Val) A37 N6-methylase TrmN6
MNAFHGKSQKFVTPITKPKVKKPDFKKVDFLEVDASSNCFITPDEIAKRAVDYLCLESFLYSKDDFQILEPSAGTGNLINALIAEGVERKKITAVENNYKLSNRIKDRFNMDVINDCFLDFASNTTLLFDRILMNPPYLKNAYNHHVNAAYDLLKEGGLLIAIVPTTFKHEYAYEIEYLPQDTFTGTKVNTKIIEMGKD